MIKAMQFIIMIWAFVLCNAAAAQSYSIRVQFNSNLRAEASLDSQVLESAPAGSVLQVTGNVGRWLKINRDGLELWMADWVSYSRVEDAAPQPANVSPAQVDNCCFVDRQCQTAQDWENGYWAFQSGQCAAPAAPQPEQIPAQPVSNAPAQVDNCCFVDRQCQSSQDWENGYWAFQNGQCAAPAPAQSQTSAQPASNASGQIDNCCLVNRQCHSEYDWDQGFYAYMAGQCPVSGGARRVAWTSYMPAGVTQFLANPSSDPFNNCCFMYHGTCQSSGDWERGSEQYRDHYCRHPAPLGTRPEIVGNAKFRNLVETALSLIATHAPEWLHFIDHSGTRKFEALVDGAGGFYNQDWSIAHGWTRFENDDPSWQPDFHYIVGYAGGITHEACHAIMQRTHTQQSGWRNEAPCVEAQLAVIEAINPNSSDVPWLRDLVANIQNPEVWWWD